MNKLNILSNHFTAKEIKPKENLLEVYRQGSNIDTKFMNKIYFGNHEPEMRMYEKVYLENPIFK